MFSRVPSFQPRLFFHSKVAKRRVAIIGAGQAGCQLGIELVKRGQKVTLYNNRTAEQVLNGKILSNQGMFNEALKIERKLGLNYWDSICPQNNAVTFSIANPNKQGLFINWVGKTKQPYQSVDQRLKFSRWMNEFERLGGDLVIQDVDLNELDKIAREHELTIIAGGKGEISQSFQRNNIRSYFKKPQRALGCLYAKNVIPDSKNPGVHSNLIPGVGEFFIMPGLTISGTCEMLLFEGIPGGAFDRWKGITDPQQQLELAKELLRKHVPWEAERCENMELTDEKATLTGSYIPVVRHPTFKLPCGKSVLGIGDTVVLNDPVSGQGANNAAKAAHLYASMILERGTQPFDEEWMNEVFNKFWQCDGKWSTKWSQLLLMEPAPYMIELLKNAEEHPELANALAEGFNQPITLFPWITSPEDTKAICAQFKPEPSDAVNENYNYGARAFAI